MSEWKKGYKVLWRRNKNLESYSLGASEGGIRYYTNKINKPKRNHGPMGVFDTLNNLLDFTGCDWDEASVYECEYIESKYDHFWNIPKVTVPGSSLNRYPVSPIYFNTSLYKFIAFFISMPRPN